MVPNFQIGAKIGAGVIKLLEEINELGVELAKFMGTGGSFKYWGNHDLKTAIEEEMGDVMASMRYTIEKNDFDLDAIIKRAETKYQRYLTWETGSATPPE